MLELLYISVSSVCKYCSRTLLVQQKERLLASVAGSSVPTVLILNCQHTFKEPPVISRRSCIQRALNGKAISSRYRNWVINPGSRVTILS